MPERTPVSDTTWNASRSPWRARDPLGCLAAGDLPDPVTWLCLEHIERSGM
jgi:hypothetical protein